MDECFRIFYNSLDASKFKYFVRGEAFYVYEKDISYIPEELKPIKGKTNLLKLTEIDQIVRNLLRIQKVGVEEYQEVICNDTRHFELSKRGYPGDFKDFMDICVDESIIPSIFAATVNSNSTVQAAFLKDSKIFYTDFNDDDLFSILFSLMNAYNCIQVLFSNPALERIFSSWGIPGLLMKAQENSVELLKKYMKYDFEVEKFDRIDCCLLDIKSFDLVGMDEFGIVTKQGARLLNQWLRSPSVDPAEIEKRLDISEMFTLFPLRIDSFGDLKRLVAKILSKKITIPEIIKLVTTVERIPELLSTFQNGLFHVSEEKRGKESLIKENFIDPLERIHNLFTPLICDIREKISFEQSRVNVNLDKNLLQMECEKYEIYKEIESEFLKVKKNYPRVRFSNKLFRITRSEYQKEDFDSKGYVISSFLKTGVFFLTKSLSKSRYRLADLTSRIEILENLLVDQIRLSLTNFASSLESFNFIISLIDVYQAFSLKTKSPSYSRPVFSTFTKDCGKEYAIEGLFHPLIEFKDCILNDISFSQNLCILTGPNMGGKSTFLKSLSMVSLYAQIGCYVPAKKAIIPIFDKIFLRIGARDCSSKGISTFMLEMVELNKILRTATKDSLVLIDELGRGTSAIDGLSLVRAIKEYLGSLGCKSVMATHFSELGDSTTLNKKMSVVDSTLTYKIEDGVCDTSFGINVAKMANFPPEVLQKAKHYLNSN